MLDVDHELAELKLKILFYLFIYFYKLMSSNSVTQNAFKLFRA